MPSDIHRYHGVHREPGRFGRHPKWDRETLVCAMRGHVTPAATVATLRPEEASLGFDLPDGRRFVRCLRCDAWLQTIPPEHPQQRVLPDLEDLELPRRGRALSDAIVLRLIALDRAIHFVIFGLLAGLFLYLDLNLGSAKSFAGQLLDSVNRIASNSGQASSRDFFSRELTKFLHVRSHTLTLLGITAAAYSVVEGAEAVGLWLEKRWAEYLTALATAGFLPFEIRELIDRITTLRVAALVVNVAILVYLIWAKRLFGIRGGPEAERRDVDRQELFGGSPPVGLPASGA